MALASSGSISIGGTTANRSINLELGRSATATSSLGESALRALANDTSGAISMSTFRGKSAALDTQTVTVGQYTVSFYGQTTNIYGYYFNGFRGSISDGTCNFKSGNTYKNLYWTDTGSGRTILTVNQGNGGNSGFTTMSVNGTNFSRTSAAFSQNSTQTQWLWTSPSTNGFGTSVGAIKSVVFT